MVLRSEQGPYYCESLGRDGDAPLTTPRDKLAESLAGVPLTRPSIHQPDFSHEQLLLADHKDTERDRQPAPGKMGTTVDRLDNLQVQAIPALICNQLLTGTAHHARLSTFGDGRCRETAAIIPSIDSEAMRLPPTQIAAVI